MAIFDQHQAMMMTNKSLLITTIINNHDYECRWGFGEGANNA